MSQQVMARMFRQAQEEEAVLLLDEGDSFLQDRQGAQRNWEITEVNEMLTPMEAFEEIFIASTNLMASPNPAALRRFDLNIRFDYLKPEQAWALFVDTGTRLGMDADQPLSDHVGCFGILTPGDFVNVVRQARLRGITTGRELFDRLAVECCAKPEGRHSVMGFV